MGIIFLTRYYIAMSNFNGNTGSSDFDDGTADIFVNSLKVNNISTPGLPLKVDANKEIYSTTLDISDTSGLQSALDATIQTPYVGVIQATDFKSDNVNSYDAIVQALVASDSTKLSKTDTADQAFISNLTLTDNTKKIIAENIDVDYISSKTGSLGTINLTGGVSQTGNQYYIENTATPANNFKINMFGGSTELRGAGGDVLLRSATDKVIVQGTELETQCTVKIADIGPKLLLKENNNTLGQGGLIQFNDEADVPQSYIFMRTTGTISLLTDSDTILDASVAEVSIGGDLKINGLTQSTNPTNGSIQTYGGLGVVGNIYNGDGITTDGDLNVVGTVNMNQAKGIALIYQAVPDTSSICMYPTAMTTPSGRAYQGGIALKARFSSAIEVPIMSWDNSSGGDFTYGKDIKIYERGVEKLIIGNTSMTVPNIINCTDTTASTLPTNGSIKTAGGAGIAGNVNIGGDLGVVGTINGLTPTGGLFSQIATKTNTEIGAGSYVSLVSTGVGSLTVPANGFKVGDSFSLKLGGTKTNGTNNQLTIRLTSGSVVLATTGTITLSSLSSAPYELEVEFTIRAIGGAGVASISTNGNFVYTDTGTYRGANFNTLNNTTFNTTIANNLEIEALQSTVSNVITCANLVLTKIF